MFKFENLIEASCVVEGATFKKDTLGRVKVLKKTVPASAAYPVRIEYSVGGDFHAKASRLLAKN